ncbi:MAG TPA: glycogen debranching enzyme, partial [Spirochaetales bacterium]|nr:glycogen debranching enzyme [Spirochaetales bacterium]
MDTTIRLQPGFPTPFGASLVPGGVNFAIFSRHATSITLELYANPSDSKAFFEYKFNPLINRTGDV